MDSSHSLRRPALPWAQSIGYNWSSCIKHSTLAAIVLVALAAIVIGATSFSGAGLNAIGGDAALAMIVTGGSLFVMGLAIICFRHCRRSIQVLSIEEGNLYGDDLQPGEFFVCRSSSDERLVIKYRLQNETKTIDFSKKRYNSCRQLYKEVTIKELELSLKII